MLLSVDDDASPILGSSSIGLANNSTFGDGLVNNNGTPSSSSPSNNSHHHYHHQLNLSMPVANGHGNMRLKLHNGGTSNQQQTPNNGYQHLYQQQQHHQTIAKVPSSKSTQLHKLCDIPGCTKYASRSRLKRQMILNAPIIEEEDKIRLLEAQEKLYICGSHNWQLKGKGKKQSGGGGGGGASGNGKASSSTSHYFNNAGSSQNDIDSVFNDFEEDSQLDRDEINDQDDSNNNGGGSMCEGLEDQDEIVDNFDVEKMRCQYDQQSNAVQESFGKNHCNLLSSVRVEY